MSMAKKNSSRGVKAAEKKLEKAGYTVLAQVKGGNRIDREHIFVVLSPLGHVMQARIKRGEDRPYRFGPVMTLDESLAYLDRTRAKDNGDGWVKEIMREWEENGYRVIDFDPHPTAIGYKLTLETPEGVIFHSFERPPWDLPPKTKPAKKNPRASFRSVPAVGHARAALQREGFSRLSFVRRAPGSRGPVLVFLGWRDETEYVLNVGRTSGDNLQVLSRPVNAQDRKVLTTGRQNPLPEDDEVREARKVLQDQFGSGHQASYPIFVGKQWRTDHKGNGVTTYIFAMKLERWDGYAGQYWFWTVNMPSQFTQRTRALTPEEQLAVLVNMSEGEP